MSSLFEVMNKEFVSQRPDVAQRKTMRNMAEIIQETLTGYNTRGRNDLMLLGMLLQVEYQSLQFKNIY